MNILSLAVVAFIGISFLFSAIVLAACALSSRSSHEAGFEEVYEYEGEEAYGVGASWVTEA